jgi:hypothetical protein
MGISGAAHEVLARLADEGPLPTAARTGPDVVSGVVAAALGRRGFVEEVEVDKRWLVQITAAGRELLAGEG